MEGHAEAHPEWEVSAWPLILTVGILFTLPFAFALYFVYEKPMLAVLSLGIGVPILVFSIAGWTKGTEKDKAHHGGKEPGYGIKAMPFFILAEAWIFIAFFAAYWATRLLSPSWPPAGTPHLGATLPIIMTIILITSSFTIHFAEGKLEQEDRGGYLVWLVITMILGTAFLIMSATEWSHLMHNGFNFKTSIFSTAFFSITGFHGSHVVVGLSMFIVALVAGFFGIANKTYVKSISLYWHFVDIIWFFVVTQIYFW